MARIGATRPFEECNDGVKNAFEMTGDLARSGLLDLGELANGKFPIMVWVSQLEVRVIDDKLTRKIKAGDMDIRYVRHPR